MFEVITVVALIAIAFGNYFGYKAAKKRSEAPSTTETVKLVFGILAGLIGAFILLFQAIVNSLWLQNNSQAALFFAAISFLSLVLSGRGIAKLAVFLYRERKPRS
jgi:hypothetical protein